MYGYIYKITDLTNGKCYVGQHKYDKPTLDPKYHGSGYLIKKIYNARPETLLEEILMICETLEEANYFEEYFIEHLNTMHPYGYNLIEGGKCRKPSRYTRIKQSRSAKRHAKESGERLRQCNLGRDPWNKGTKGVCKPNSGSFKKGQKPSQKAIEKATKHYITHAELYYLYTANHTSIRQIAQIFNCSERCITRKLKQFSIPLRLAPCCDITYDTLYNLYIKDNLPAAYIANLLDCSRKTIIHKLKKYNINKHK